MGPHVAKWVVVFFLALLLAPLGATPDGSALLVSDPPLEVNIAVLSGNGQQGVVGTCAAESLVVQVTDASTGQPVERLFVQFEITSGEGQLADHPTLSSITDSDGKAGFTFVYGLGPATVSASIPYNDSPSVSFALEGVYPVVDVLSQPFAGEYPGSALGSLFTFLVKDGTGTPLPRVRVDAHQSPAGESDIGYFLPSVGVTDANGMVSFAFVINATATPGEFFHLTFSLPDTAGSAGSPLSIGPFGFQVLDPSMKNVFIISGQGQIGRAQNTVPKKLLVQLVTDADPFTADDVAGFTIFGANPAQIGSLEVVDGTLVESTSDQGQTIAVKVKVNGANQASVLLHLNTLPGPALIGVSSSPGGIFADTFAIGREEVRLLGGEAQGFKEPSFATGQSPEDVKKGPGIASYLVEVRTITGLGDTLALGGVRSYDECNSPFASSGGIPSSLDGLLLKKIGENDRFATYRLPVNTPVIALNQSAEPGELPQGPHYVAVDTDGYLQAVTTDPAGNLLYGVLQDEVKVRIAWTFDDGPTMSTAGAKGDRTGTVLKTLEDKKVKATFFVEHSRAKNGNAQKLMLKMVEAKHEIAIHGAHPTKHHYSWAITSDLDKQLDDLIKIIKILPLAGGTEVNPKGQESKFARPPGGEATLKSNITNGKVTSIFLTNKEGATPVVYDDIKKIEKILSDRKLTMYLGDGTSTKDSWLAVVPDEEKDLKTFYNSIEKVFKEAVAKKAEKKLVILSHDIRPLDSSKLGEFIDKINQMGKDHKVGISYETMSELTK